MKIRVLDSLNPDESRVMLSIRRKLKKSLFVEDKNLIHDRDIVLVFPHELSWG